MKLGDMGKVKQISIVIVFSLMAIYCLFMASNEVIIGNSQPIDINTATVEQIQSDKLIDVKINATVGSFAYKTGSSDEYYLIPMGNGKFIIFVTGDANQKKELDNFIYTYDGTNGTLNLNVKGRIYHLTSEEENVFFNSIVEADIGLNSIAEAKQYILPYKIVNYVSYVSWIFVAIALISMLLVALSVLSLVKQSRRNKTYVNSVQYQNTMYNENPNAYNPYSQNDYYTGYEDTNSGDINSQGSQTNDNQSNINRF